MSRNPSRLASRAALALATVTIATTPAFAETETITRTIETRDRTPWGVGVELLGSAPVDDVNGAMFGFGKGGAIHVEYGVSPKIGLHVGVLALSITAGDSGESTEWLDGHAGARYHLGHFGDRDTDDGWIDAHFNYGYSGGIKRGGFDVGIGYELGFGDDFRLGPVMRYQFGSDPLDQHAQLLTLGISAGFWGARHRRTVTRETRALAGADDRDGDGILDEEDDCPREHHGKNPDPERPGCPTRDYDGDRVVDAEDECPKLHHGPQEDPLRPGCPAPDRDADRIADADDACPDEPGAPHRDPGKNGCPGLVRVAGSQIEILEPIYFAYDSDRIERASYPVLQAVVEAIETLEIGMLRIEGHTDDRGSDGYNLELSQRRAMAVVRWLTQRGVSPEKMQAIGYGKQKPVSDAHADNRRVEFHILDEDYEERTPSAQRDRRAGHRTSRRR